MKGAIDQTAIREGLARLGLTPTCRIMAHASLSALGMVEGGPGAVVGALREAAGPRGAVIMPSFRDAIRSDHYALRRCAPHCPQDLCPSRERGCTGAVGETLREQPDALRSCHPTHSWVGVGADAEFLLSGHRQSLTPCGAESPFFRMMERGGAVLLLGVGVNSLTNLHAVEDARNVPYLSAIDPPRRHATYTTSARRIQYVFPELLHAALREAGVLRSAPIGLAACHALDARTLGSFLWVITEDDPWCLALRPCPDRYDPFADACAKVARIVRVWQDRPEPDAWHELLAASRKPRQPAAFAPAPAPATACPAYRGVIRGQHRCAANDLPPWEKFDEFPRFEPGVATCDRCNWPATRAAGMRPGAGAIA